MMIIVKALAPNNNTPWANVSTFVIRFAISIPPKMSYTVNYTCGPEWNPYHLYAPYYGANPTPKPAEFAGLMRRHVVDLEVLDFGKSE